VIGVASLLIMVTLGLMITRVAAVALRTTGLSTEVARAWWCWACGGATGADVGMPSGGTTIQAGDTVIAYGEAGQLDELRDRKEGASGDEAHERASVRRRRLLHHQEDQLLQGGRTE
jgi:hypothetical protein